VPGPGTGQTWAGLVRCATKGAGGCAERGDLRQELVGAGLMLQAGDGLLACIWPVQGAAGRGSRAAGRGEGARCTWRTHAAACPGARARMQRRHAAKLYLPRTRPRPPPAHRPPNCPRFRRTTVPPRPRALCRVPSRARGQRAPHAAAAARRSPVADAAARLALRTAPAPPPSAGAALPSEAGPGRRSATCAAARQRHSPRLLSHRTPCTVPPQVLNP